MTYQETTIIKTGVLVGINPNVKAGHFYRMSDGEIYRASKYFDIGRIYPICTQAQLDKMIEKGKILTPQ